MIFDAYSTFRKEHPRLPVEIRVGDAADGKDELQLWDEEERPVAVAVIHDKRNVTIREPELSIQAGNHAS